MPRSMSYRGTKFSEREFSHLSDALKLDSEDRRMLVQVLRICSAGQWDVGGPYSDYRIKQFLEFLNVIPFDPTIRWHPSEQCALGCTAYIDITTTVARYRPTSDPAKPGYDYTSGHKGVCLKYQVATTAQGTVIALNGPWPGRRHDIVLTLLLLLTATAAESEFISYRTLQPVGSPEALVNFYSFHSVVAMSQNSNHSQTGRKKCGGFLFHTAPFEANVSNPRYVLTEQDKGIVTSVFHSRCDQARMQPAPGTLEQVMRQVETLVSAHYIPPRDRMPLQWGVVGGTAEDGTPVTDWPLDPEFATCVVAELYTQRGSFDLSETRTAKAFLKNTALRIKQVAQYHGDWPHRGEAIDAAMTRALQRWIAHEWVRITGRSKEYNHAHYAKIQEANRMDRQRNAGRAAERPRVARPVLRATAEGGRGGRAEVQAELPDANDQRTYAAGQYAPRPERHASRGDPDGELLRMGNQNRPGLPPRAHPLYDDEDDDDEQVLFEDSDSMASTQSDVGGPDAAIGTREELRSRHLGLPRRATKDKEGPPPAKRRPPASQSASPKAAAPSAGKKAPAKKSTRKK
jgi:hypothetical protein